MVMESPFRHLEGHESVTLVVIFGVDKRDIITYIDTLSGPPLLIKGEFDCKPTELAVMRLLTQLPSLPPTLYIYVFDGLLEGSVVNHFLATFWNRAVLVELRSRLLMKR